MSPFYDQQSDQLSDALGYDNNNVGYLMDQAFNQENNTDTGGLLGGNDDSGLLGCTVGTTTKAAREARTANKENSESPLGSPYASPLGWAERITGFARSIPDYFKPNANEYTNSLVDARRPQKGQPAKAIGPQDTYDKFFARLRNFARAEETSEKGRVQIRTT